MGLFKKEKYRLRRRLFGQPCGRNSFQCKESDNNQRKKQQNTMNKYRNEQTQVKCHPYQIVRKVNAQSGLSKVVVRRVLMNRDRRAKLLALGKTSLKYKLCSIPKQLAGNRIVNLNCLKEHVVTISVHSALCIKARELAEKGSAPVTLEYEKRKNGLCSIIVAVCRGCMTKFDLDTSKKQENGLFDVNVRAVWGTVASGGGAADLREQLGTMDVPPMTSKMFSSVENQIGEWWKVKLKEEMAKAGAEERRIAMEKGKLHEGVPAVTVICDGGWSKRSHKHTYDAHGGVGVIFGAVTKKLLFMGVRNSNCIVCSRAKNKLEPVKDHKCFKNWSKSSQAMEADIMLEGFLEAEAVHGLRYTKIIADGDSSVFPHLQENVPWGRDIQKLECANHTCKCLRSNLEKLVTEKPHFKGKGKLTKLNRIRITTAVRCAIKMRSKDRNTKQLRSDILNSIHHVLGFHERCSEFCKRKSASQGDDEGCDQEEENKEEEEDIDQIFEDQCQYWKLPSDQDMENARHAGKNSVSKEETHELIRDVQVLLNKVAQKSERLIENFTTNLCESWMAIRAKFDGGKVINRCSRGSWNTRCYGGALRKNIGVQWSPITFQHVTHEQPGQHFFSVVRRQTQLSSAVEKYKAKPESKLLRRKRKINDCQQSSTKKAKQSYGSHLDDSPDVSAEQLDRYCDSFLRSKVNVSQDAISRIQKNTVQQSASPIWTNERQHRLTSSNFGKVMSRRPTNTSTALVQSMLYSKFKGNLNTIRGLAQEENTIIEYSNLKGDTCKVSKTGLRISESHPFLAASTDGIVTCTIDSSTGLLEVKNLLQNNKYSIREAVKKVPNFCLEIVEEKLTLKRTHGYFYQIQGQLNIFGKIWCDFALRRTNPYDMYVERIYCDNNLWANEMLPKLEAFYFKFMLPELALPRFGTYTGIRKPEKPWFTTSVARKPVSAKVKAVKTAEGKRSTDPPPGPSTGNSQASEPCAGKPVSAKEKGADTSKAKCSSQSVTDQLTPGPSHRNNHLPQPTPKRSRRSRTVKFVGRQIHHKWVMVEKNKKSKWYIGTVLDVVSGKDGDRSAVYEVLYKGEDSSHDVDGLQADLEDGTLKFLDI